MALKVGGVVVLVAAAAALLGWLLVSLGHAPEAREIPVAVVGEGAAVSRVSKALDESSAFAVTRAADGAAARKLIRRRKVDGAYAPLAKSGRVITASAASVAVARVMRATFTKLDAKRGVRTVVTEARALPESDSAGSTAYIVTLVAAMIAVLGAWWLEFWAPSIRRGPAAALLRIGVLVLLSLGIGAILAAIATQLGIYEGDFFVVAGALALATLGTAVVTAFLTSLVGVALGAVVGLAVFLVVGVLATSGGGSGPEFLPDVWRQIGSGLPARSSIELVRNLVYFDHEAITTPLFVLAAYVIGGIALMLALSPFRRVSS
jgi:hypothetical protein